jgi:hypothetical protein
MMHGLAYVKFMEIRPVGDELFHSADGRTDGRTDRHDKNNSVRDFAKASKSGLYVVRVENQPQKTGAELVVRKETINFYECGSLSPRHGTSSGCGWRNCLLYGG